MKKRGDVCPESSGNVVIELSPKELDKFHSIEADNADLSEKLDAAYKELSSGKN